MSMRHLLAATAAAVLGFSLAAPAAAQVSVAGGIGIGSGRLVPTVAAVVGLIGVVLGGLALARSRRAGALH